jgi:hypothetical protein
MQCSGNIMPDEHGRAVEMPGIHQDPFSTHVWSVQPSQYARFERGHEALFPRDGSRTYRLASDTVNSRWTFLPCSPQHPVPVGSCNVDTDSHAVMSFLWVYPAMPCLQRSKHLLRCFVRLQLVFLLFILTEYVSAAYRTNFRTRRSLRDSRMLVAPDFECDRQRRIHYAMTAPYNRAARLCLITT